MTKNTRRKHKKSYGGDMGTTQGEMTTTPTSTENNGWGWGSVTNWFNSAKESTTNTLSSVMQATENKLKEAKDLTSQQMNKIPNVFSSDSSTTPTTSTYTTPSTNVGVGVGGRRKKNKNKIILTTESLTNPNIYASSHLNLDNNLIKSTNKFRTKRIKGIKRKGGSTIATNAAPVHGLSVATPTYWIKGGKKSRRSKRSKITKRKGRHSRKSRK